MEKKKLIIGGVLLLVAIGGYMGFRYIKERQQAKANEKSGSRDEIAPVLESFPLAKGKRGDNVTKLQKWLNINLKVKKQPEIKVDGIFGTETETALKAITGKTTMDKTYFDNAKIANL